MDIIEYYQYLYGGGIMQDQIYQEIKRKADELGMGTVKTNEEFSNISIALYVFAAEKYPDDYSSAIAAIMKLSNEFSQKENEKMMECQ